MPRIIEKVLDVLFPVHCPFCDGIVGAKEVYMAKDAKDAAVRRLVCPKCLPKLRPVREPFCMKCGKQLEDAAQYCPDCCNREHLFVQGRSLLLYDGAVRYSIYRFKYGGRKEYARAYAALTMLQLQDYIRMIAPDYLIPVPLHKKRFSKRGYNQAQLYAAHLGSLLSIPCRDDIAVRVKNTRPQKELDVQKRQNNLKKAFKIVGNDVKLKTIILIDDIFTTGSTIDALSRELLAAGAAGVYFLTIAGGA